MAAVVVNSRQMCERIVGERAAVSDGEIATVQKMTHLFHHHCWQVLISGLE